MSLSVYMPRKLSKNSNFWSCSYNQLPPGGALWYSEDFNNSEHCAYLIESLPQNTCVKARVSRVILRDTTRMKNQNASPTPIIKGLKMFSFKSLSHSVKSQISILNAAKCVFWVTLITLFIILTPVSKQLNHLDRISEIKNPHPVREGLQITAREGRGGGGAPRE